MSYGVNSIVELIDKDYVDCCEWMKVGYQYIITDIDKDGRVILKGLFRNEHTTVLDLEKSFRRYGKSD